MPRYALAVLTAMNLLNYLDRFVPSAVKDLFKADLDLTDTQTSLPLTAFVIVYMVTSPIFGTLADKWSRKHLIAAGVALWSLATAAAAMATGFASFFAARALVGVGEAAYATISPALIGDFYPPEKRNKALTVFYVAIPVGAALGFGLGAALGEAYGWRAAFLICGLPGLLVALLALRIVDPGRGVFDEKKPPRNLHWREVFGKLRSNPRYVNAVIGYTLVTFASGAMADWFPTFLSRSRGFSMAEAGRLIGILTATGGLLGTMAGGFIGDRLKTRQPYFAVSGMATAVSALGALGAMLFQDKIAICACIFVAQFFLWFYNGPINTILVNSVEADIRARAFGISILSTHLLGDAISPPIVGLLSDHVNLISGVALVPLFLAGGALVWLRAWRRC